MARILLIETSTAQLSAALSEDGAFLDFARNDRGDARNDIFVISTKRSAWRDLGGPPLDVRIQREEGVGVVERAEELAADQTISSSDRPSKGLPGRSLFRLST